MPQMEATDDHRAFQLDTPFGRNVLLFKRLEGSERLGRPFEYEISALSENGGLDPDKILGQSATVRGGGDGPPLFLNGIVTEFGQVDYGTRFHEYRFTLRPWYWLLTQTSDCRVFQAKTVEDIFKSLVKELGYADFRFNLKGKHDELAYCVQYRETAFNFLSRLLEHEGIYYYFEHEEKKHTMVLVDDSSVHKSAPGLETVPYRPPAGADEPLMPAHLSSWTFAKSVQPVTYAATDFDLKKPQTSLLKSKTVKLAGAPASAEIYDYPADLPIAKDTSDTALLAAAGDHLAQVRLAELQARYKVARGSGNALGLSAGSKFTLSEYPRDDLNKDYLVVATDLALASNPHETGSQEKVDIHVGVETIELATRFCPPRVTPKPVVQGAQTATVVGKAGEEIDTDDLGRVKVQFHWDRKGKKDENSSCRLRVAQVWAGKEWGAIHVPRIGQEVIVSFLEGDPDRPIVTGRVYNGDNKPPYKLPDNATQSGIKSRSSKGGDPKTFNEIRFEDKKDSEELLIHAQKDFKVDVENDATWQVGTDDADPPVVDIGNKGVATFTIGKTLKTDVGEDATWRVGLRGKGSPQLAKSQEGVAKFEVGKTLMIDVGDEITLVTGQSKIVMKKDGSIAITCKSFEVKASQEIVAKSLQVAVEGTTKVEIKSSAQTKVEGTMLDLSASGIATLKGALTKIN